MRYSIAQGRSLAHQAPAAWRYSPRSVAPRRVGCRWRGDLKACYFQPGVRGSSCSQEGNMTITRIFCFAGALALATLIGTSASSYAAQSCCKWVGDKYINLKTGKLVKSPKSSIAPLDAGV